MTENNTTYAPLPLTFKKNGFDYKQVNQTNTVAIYEQLYSTKSIAFEVYRIKTQEAGERIMAGTVVKREAKEILPSTGEWGKYAYTCGSLTEAHRKASQLSQTELEGKDRVQGE